MRHLVMPNGELEAESIMSWLAQELGPDVVVHCMEQYMPRAHVGKPKRRTGRSRFSTTDGDQANGPEETTAAAVVNREVRYEDINRPVSEYEVTSVRKFGADVGLWRFIDPASHAGFHT